MRKYLLYVTFLMGFLSLSGCGEKQAVAVAGDGNITTETRTVESFNGIEFAGDYQVALVSGKPQQITITADKNIQPYLTTTVKKDGLLIGPQEGSVLKPTSPIKIIVSAPQIAAIGVVGNTQVDASGLNNHNTILLIKGNGQITVSGQSESAAIHLAGNGSINAKDLKTQKANVVVKGGNVSISVSDNLSAVSENGKITYFGSPELRQVIKGGEVVKG